MAGTLRSDRRVASGSRGPEALTRLLGFVAKLYYAEGRDQSEIARIAGVSRSSISRLLTQARGRGIVRISVEEHDSRERSLEDALRRRFGLRHVVVVRPFDGSGVEAVRRTIGYVAAPVISELIQPRAVVGVAGGRTLTDLVRYMAPTRPVADVRVAQLMGNIGPAADLIDAIELSRALAQRFGGTFYALNAPAFAEDGRARGVFLAHPHLREVWELFRQIDVALVGIGTLTDSAFIERGVLEPAALAALRTAGAVGEICGRFFDRAGTECATPYRRRVMSIGLDELARRSDVVVVTNGSQRAEALQAAFTGGLVKSLVIDEAGARAVLGEPARAGARRASDRAGASAAPARPRRQRRS
jgi:DNA-binding transcriptional regulator LsrR (DeoR family)